MARHQTFVAVLSLALTIAIPVADADDGCPEACWEQCFRVSFWSLYTPSSIPLYFLRPEKVHFLFENFLP